MMTRQLIERIQRRLSRGLMASNPLAGLSSAWRKYRIAPVLALALALVALFAGAGPGAGAGGEASVTNTPAAHVVVGALPARHLLIGSADLHIETATESAEDGDSELEVNLAISQTASDCQTPLYGEFCLRYDILVDDAAVQAGYGLIPVSDVRVTGSVVLLTVDTRHEPRVVRTAGDGGLIQLTWSLPNGLPQPVLHATGVSVATVRGRLIEYTIPSDDVTAGVLVYGGA